MKGAWAVLAAVGLVCVAWAASRQNHPAARVLAGAFCGLGALGAVNLLGSYTGVTLALNYAAAYASVVLGAPGVITLLVLRSVWQEGRGNRFIIAALVLVNLTLAIMCLPSKTLTQTKWLAGALRPFAGLFGLNEAELTYTAPATGSTIVGAAQPLIITLSTEAGRQSAQYDFAALDELYGQYGSLLAQALESAETPQACTRTEFYAALRGTGAAFCFPGAISPSVLGAWLNVRAPEGGQAQWYVLAQEEDGVTLYLAGEQFSAAKTALPAQSLTAQLETAVPDGSFFAFEAGQEPYAALDGLSLISAQSAQVSTGQSANPCDARFISALAAQIGINPYGDARFVDNDGTTSFTETNLSLRVSAQGQILLQVLQADPRFQSASLDERDRIEAARSLLSSLTGDDYGDARVYLQSYTADGTQAVCTFGYYLSGVEAAAGSGIEIRFDGTQITRASVLYRRFTLDLQPAALLPAAQAAACLPRGGTLRLLYAENAGGELAVGWQTN